jgi:hypothetical protein
MLPARVIGIFSIFLFSMFGRGGQINRVVQPTRDFKHQTQVALELQEERELNGYSRRCQRVKVSLAIGVTSCRN